MKQFLLRTWLALTCGLITGTAWGEASGARPIHLVRVQTPRARDLYQLHRLGVDLVSRESRTAVQVAASAAELLELRRLGYHLEVLIEDLEAHYRTELGAGAERYHTFPEVVAVMDALHDARPDIAGAKQAIGWSWEGRPIWAMKISDHPELDEDEPEVLYDALHHAREPVGMETALATMQWLVERYDTDPEVRYLVNEREMWFVPVVNPDGYVYGGLGGLWRKNRRPNDDGSFGVDLNRNYGYQWGFDDTGSSPLPRTQTYRGPYPFSEPETRAMRDFILERRFVTGMTIHTFSNVHLMPFGFAESRPPHWHDFRELGEDLQALTGYPYGQPWELLYLSNGRTQDWAYYAGGVLMVEPEIGSATDGFWPAAARVDSLVALNMPGLLHVARVAGAHVEVTGLELLEEEHPNGFAEPGEAITVGLKLRNKGYRAAVDLVAELSSALGDLHPLDSQLVVGRLAARSEPTASVPVRLRLAPDCSVGHPLKLDLVWMGASGYASHSVATIYAGIPEVVFADDGGSGLERWRTSSWGVVEAAAGPAFTDSPGGTYPPGANHSLVLAEPLDLSRYHAARLTYSERYFTEPWTDLCTVEASVDDVIWQTVAVQAGGRREHFAPRSIDLSAFAGADGLRLRFRLTANALNQRDGWTIDDIRVWGFRRPARWTVAESEPPAPPPPPAPPVVVESE